MDSHHFFSYDFPTGATADTCGEPDFYCPEAMAGGVQPQVWPCTMWHAESAAPYSFTPSYPSNPYPVYPAAYPTMYGGYGTPSQPSAMENFQPQAQELSSGYLNA